MSDLISRQYAIEHYQHVCRRTNCKECPLHIQVTDTLTDCELELFLHNMPSAEPERKKGKWMHDKDDVLVSGYCSCCGWVSIIMETDVADMSFCPNCGAEMLKGEDDAEVH